MPAVAALVAALSTVVAGCAEDDPIQSGVMGINAQVGSIQLLGVHVEAPPQPRYLPGETARVWLTLVNAGTTTDALLEIASPVADQVRIHWDQDCDGQYDTVPALPLAPAEPALRGPPTGAVAFDAYHLQIVDFTEEVLAGTNIEMTFHFEQAGTVTVQPHVQPHNAPRAEPTARCVP